MSISLIAIAKNEEAHVVEWISHHLMIGFDNIVIYDNGSTDATGKLIERISLKFPVIRIPWISPDNLSPQRSAYSDALKNSRSNWVAFFDLDEMLVLDRKYRTIGDFVNNFPDDVSAIGFNWLTLGSGGVQKKGYGLMRNAFRTGAERNWGNNRHIKTIAKTRCIEAMYIHHCDLKEGRYVHPNGLDLTMTVKKGMSDSVDHSVAQLNHYQVRSIEDFWEKMRRGRAGVARNDARQLRAQPEKFLKKLDRNDYSYNDIDRYHERFNLLYAAVLDAAA